MERTRGNRIAQLIGLVIVVALAALLRFDWAGVNSFAFDEARLSLLSQSMVERIELTTLGMPSSAGVPNPPGAVWLMSLPYLATTDPLAATIFVGLVSIGGVVAVWATARSAWGGWAAFAAGLFIAASPFAVLYSRSIWAQNFLPPLAALWVMTAYLAIVRENKLLLLLHVVIAGFAWQVHLAGAALALGTFYAFFRFGWWRWPRLLMVLLGGLVAVVATLPFALRVLNDPALVAQFRAAMGGEAVFDVTSLDNILVLALGRDWAFLSVGNLADQLPNLPTALLSGILLLIGIPGLVLTLFFNPGKDPRPQRVLAELTLVLLIISPILFIRHSTPVFLHYQLIGLPALALIVGAGVFLMPFRIWRALVGVAALVLAGLWYWQITTALGIAGRQETPNGLGTPLGLSRAAAYSLPASRPSLLFTHGDNPEIDGEAAVFSALWWGRDYRIVQGESLVILPNQPAFLMATLAPFQAWEELQASGLVLNPVSFPRREGALPFMATAYEGGEPTGFEAISPIPLQDGTQVEGWRARWVGPRLRISTLWRVTAPPPPGATLQQFHHLAVPGDEGEDMRVSDVPISAHRWAVGDRLIVMADYFDVAPGCYQMRVGHYSLPDIVRVQRVNPEREVTTDPDSILLGVFAIASDAVTITYPDECPAVP